MATSKSKHYQLQIPAVFLCLLLAIVAASGTGFGANTSTQTVSAQLQSTISMSNPDSVSTAIPLCTKTLAPADTDACNDVTFTTAPAQALSLGSLSGADVQAGALTWRVTTTNPAGYVVRMSNAGSAPVMRSSAGTIADMPDTPISASAVAGSTHFGVAMGNPSTNNETSVSFAGSPWVTSSGQQGSLFRSVPVSGMVVAQKTAPATNEPFTATFAAASIVKAIPPTGAYSGNVSVVASTL